MSTSEVYPSQKVSYLFSDPGGLEGFAGQGVESGARDSWCFFPLRYSAHLDNISRKGKA